MTQEAPTHAGVAGSAHPRARARSAPRPSPRGSPALDARPLVAAALGRLEPNGESSEAAVRFLPALERLTHAIVTEARLTAAGRHVARDAIVGSLLTQLRADRLLAERPEIETVDVSAPLFIVGLPRTGSTLLHNLLAQHPALRAPLLWELMYPASRVRTAAERRRLIDATAAYVREYYRAAPAFRAIHFLHPELPEECHRLLATTFTNDIFGIRYRVPGYIRWLRGQDVGNAYAYHRTLLRCLLWRTPGDRVVLKCPTHVWQVEALAATYPQARLVRLHRDPTQAIASVSSLTAVVRAARSDAVNREEIGRYWLEQVTLALAGARRGTEVAGLQVLDVRYRDLVRDPLAVVAAVCDFAHVPLGHVAEWRMRRFLAADPHRTTGIHRYSPEEFGISRGEVDARLVDYRTEFGV